MATVKYSSLPTTDSEDCLTFDYSSAFTFEDRSNFGWKYRSAFTYGTNKNVQNLKASAFCTLQRSAPTKIDRLARLLVIFGYIIIYVFAFPIMVWFSFKKVPEDERLVVFRLGYLLKLKGPGFVFLFPVLDRSHKINVRLRAFSVPPKQIITEDGAIIEVGADIYFQVVDAKKSVTNVQNLDQSTRILVQTSLCNILAKKTLADIEAERTSIAEALLESSNKTSKDWGVEISRAELSQIKVLCTPPEKKPPMFVKPPGLFGSDSGGMPAVLAQLVANLATSQGQNQAQAISQAVQSVVADYMPNMDIRNSLTTNTNDLAAFLGCATLEKHESKQSHADDDSLAVAPMQSVPSLVPSISLASPAPPSPVLRPVDVLNLIRMSLCESVVEKVQETYQFDISGLDSGTYYLDLKHGKGAVGEGPDPGGDPAAILGLTFDDLQAMLLGQLKPFQAYMSGRLKVSGDTAAALKLEELGTRIKSLSFVR